MVPSPPLAADNVGNDTVSDSQVMVILHFLKYYKCHFGVILSIKPCLSGLVQFMFLLSCCF